MRSLPVLAPLLAISVSAGGRAAEEPPNAGDENAPPADDIATLRAEMAAQASALEKLQAGLEEEKRAREQPAVRVRATCRRTGSSIIRRRRTISTFDEPAAEPGSFHASARARPGRRRHRDAGERAEIDANTTNGPQVRPVEARRLLALARDGCTRWFVCRSHGRPDADSFGAELSEGDSVRPFLERSTVMRALFPGQFDLGARLQGRYRFIHGAFAVMNGSPLGDRVFPALAPSKAKDFVGRLGLRAEIIPGIRLEMGVSAETGAGFHKGTPTTKDQVVWRDDNGDGLVQATEIRVIPGVSATPSELLIDLRSARMVG